MQSRLVLLLLMAFLGAAGARADGPVSAVAAACVTANVNVLGDSGGESLYRIVFTNRCGATRTFFWCAENAATSVPAVLVCPRGRGFAAEPRHSILQRKEFQ